MKTIFVMDWYKRLFLVALLVVLPLVVWAADNAHAVPTPAVENTGTAAGAVATEVAQAGEHAGATAEHHGLPAAAPRIRDGFVTSSMVITWVVVLFLVLFAQIATRQIKEIPEGAQNFWEWLVESLHDFLEGIIGPDLVKKTFWFFGGLFIFILFSNWISLIPGVGTIGWGSDAGHGFRVSEPILRGVNADLNMTLSMSVIFFVLWTVWALQFNGFKGFILHIFGPKGDTVGFMKVAMVVVFVFVGLLETVSIMFRPVSLSFRLYGNIFAGENMLESMMGLVSSPVWLKYLASFVVPIPFYFLEVLVGLVQALVFMLLTSVFTLLICSHEEGHEKGHLH